MTFCFASAISSLDFQNIAGRRTCSDCATPVDIPGSPFINSFASTSVLKSLTGSPASSNALTGFCGAASFICPLDTGPSGFAASNPFVKDPIAFAPFTNPPMLYPCKVPPLN